MLNKVGLVEVNSAGVKLVGGASHTQGGVEFSSLMCGCMKAPIPLLFLCRKVFLRFLVTAWKESLMRTQLNLRFLDNVVCRGWMGLYLHWASCTLTCILLRGSELVILRLSHEHLYKLSCTWLERRLCLTIYKGVLNPSYCFYSIGWGTKHQIITVKTAGALLPLSYLHYIRAKLDAPELKLQTQQFSNSFATLGPPHIHWYTSVCALSLQLRTPLLH